MAPDIRGGLYLCSGTRIFTGDEFTIIVEAGDHIAAAKIARAYTDARGEAAVTINARKIEPRNGIIYVDGL